MPVTIGSPTNIVKTNLCLHLDVGDTNSYPGSGTVWYDLSGNGQHFNVSASAYNSSGPKYFDFNGSYGCAKRSTDTTFYNTDMTAVVWTRVKNSTSEWRTLFRGLSSGGDHQVIIQSGGWNIGMYDNVNGTGFNDTGFSQQSLPNYNTSNWVMMTWRWSNGQSPYYRLSYNDTPSTFRGVNNSSNARFKCGICSIGAYNNGDGSNVTNASQYWGDVAVVMMYNRYLTDAEVLQNYHYYASRFGVSATQGLVLDSGGGLQTTAKNDKGTLISISTFTSNGTFTMPVGCSKVLVQVVGGGGGSCGYCESGGAGGFAEGFYSISPGTNVSVTIGGGGGAGGYYSGCGNGGTTSFGSYISASGGYGANQNYSHGGGHGGVGSGGQINLYGGTGTGHANGGSHGQSGAGGGSYFGGPPGKTRGQTWGNFSGAYGTGATGDRGNDGHHGDNGVQGLCIVYAYK